MTGMHWGRKAVIGFGVAFLMIGVWCVCIGRRENKKFREWEKAVPMKMELDLGVRGENMASFTQVCPAVTCALEFHTGIANPEMNLKALRGTVVVRKRDGREVAHEVIDGSQFGWMYRTNNTQVPAIYLEPLETGVYQVEVTITEPATGLNARNHLIIGSCLFCGRERVPAIITMIVGWLFLFFASICAVMTYRYLWRRGKMT